MKTRLIVSILFLLAFTVNLQAQIILFQEDFESTPITSVVNTFTDSVPDGPSPCGQASRGTTADFNSTSVDFQNAQNASYFLGVNPESPCGGFYGATLISDTLDWSGFDSLVFKCRYFKSTTLGWGATTLRFVFDNGAATDSIVISFTNFTTNDNWDSEEVTISSAMISPSVVMTIKMGGGEGVGIDDISILGYITTNIIKPNPYENIKLYPIPVSEFLNIETKDIHLDSDILLIDHYGRNILKQTIQQGQKTVINFEDLASGVYILKILNSKDKEISYKILKN